jgi:hypothetical protein
MSYRLTSADGARFGDLTLYKLGQLVREGKISLHETICRSGAGSSAITVETLLGGIRPVDSRRIEPPRLSWVSAMVAGSLSGGYLLNVPALRLGIWSCRLMPKISAIVLPLIGLVLPPAHLIYALMLIWGGEKHHVLYGLLHLGVGFFAAEAISLLCAGISSLIIRQTLLDSLGHESGLQINLWLTLLLNSIYLTYKISELRAMYGLPDN